MTVSRRVLTRHIARQLAAGADKQKLLTELAAYLITNKQTGQLELVVADIIRNLASLGTVKATVYTARALTDELRKAVEAYVTRTERTTSVQLEELVDASLVGGVVVETPHNRYDASIATQLKRLRNV